MQVMHLPATETTPEVRFNPDAADLSLRGCSIHENADRFYRPLIEQVQAYASRPAAHTKVSIRLDYFNSSSSKYLLDLLKVLEEIHRSGKSAVEVEWHFEGDDLDMEEAGRDYQELLELPFNLVSDRPH